MITQDDIDSNARLILIHPYYHDQHLVLSFFLDGVASKYVCFRDDNLTQGQVVAQVAAVYSENDALDYLILDECDRAEADALEAIVRQLLRESETLRIVLLTRGIPKMLRDDSGIRAITQVWPVNWSWRLSHFTAGSQRPHLEVHAFGRGRVYVDGDEIENWGGQRTRDLFFFMVDNPIITRDIIFDFFWPDLSVTAATNVFHVTKASIHRVLGFDLIEYREGYYRLTDDMTFIYDVDVFHTMAQHGVDEPDELLLTMANRMFKNDFLQGNEMTWAAVRRAELALHYSECVSELAGRKVDQDDTDVALGLYIRALGVHMGREDIAGKVMQIYFQQNQSCDALTVYERTYNYLTDVVGYEPDEPLRALGDDARRLCDEPNIKR